VIPGREVDLRVMSVRGFTNNAGEPEGAFAEPVSEHGDVTITQVDNAPFVEHAGN
jgi:hypothetical protein